MRKLTMFTTAAFFFRCSNQCLISLSSEYSLGPLFRSLQPDIAHPCCDRLIAVTTGYPLTSITRLSRAQVSIRQGRVFFDVIR